MNARWLGLVFTAVAAFGIGCMVQANSISTMVQETFRVSPWITGGIMTVPTAVVILGGIQSWSFADVANGLMAVPNLVSLLALAGVAAQETRRFLWEGDLEGSA